MNIKRGQKQPPVNSSSMVEHYRRCVSSEIFIEKNQRHDHARWEVVDALGKGASELIHLESGLNIGLEGCQLNGSFSKITNPPPFSFNFFILFSGGMEFFSQDCADTLRLGPGELIFGNGVSGQGFVLDRGSFISGVSVSIFHTRLESWLGDKPCSLSKRLERYLKRQQPLPGKLSLPAHHSLMQTAKALYTKGLDTLYARLQFESLALDCLYRFLSLEVPFTAIGTPSLTYRQRAADEARAIVEEEWASSLTIGSLARRVGVNECYLKADFRSCSGLSIGEYIRKLRMENALKLIKSGHLSVSQAASFVGYANPSHFSEAFKRFHGRLPSSFL